MTYFHHFFRTIAGVLARLEIHELYPTLTQSCQLSDSTLPHIESPMFRGVLETTGVNACAPSPTPEPEPPLTDPPPPQVPILCSPPQPIYPLQLSAQ